MQLLVGDPTFIEDLLVLLRLLLWSKHEKVPVYFFYKQLQASGSCCCHSRKHAGAATACSAPSTCTRGWGWLGRKSWVYTATLSHCSAAIWGLQMDKGKGLEQDWKPAWVWRWFTRKSPFLLLSGLETESRANTVTLGACPLTETFSNMWQNHVSPYSWAHLLFPFTSFLLASLFAWSRNGCWLPVRIMGRKRCEPSKAVIGQQVLVKVSRWNHPF